MDLADAFPDGGEPVPLKDLVRRATEAVERVALSRVLEQTHGNKNKAAQLLGLNRTTLLEKIKKRGLTPPE